MTSRTPTATSNLRASTRCAMRAPMGAATTPPISNPSVATVNAFHPKVAMNVAEMVAVSSYSAVLTVPITRRGSAP